MKDLRSGDRVGSWTVDHVISYVEPGLVAAHRSSDPRERATLVLARSSPVAEALQKRHAEVLGGFSHPRIPAVLESGRTEGWCILALRAFSGDSLSDRLVGGVDWRQAVVWLYELAVTLRDVHREGWVHGSVHPQNLFVAPRHQVWLMGFETARRTGSQRPGGLPEAAMGYVAPEVLRDAGHDGQRADLYAFGLVAYEMLTGESAFPAAAWANQTNRERALLEWKTRSHELDVGPEQPDWLRGLVRKCTHPVPEQRLPDMETVVSFLEASRSTWELPELKATPVAIPRGGLPELDLQPTLVQHQQLLAWRQAQLEQQATNRTLMVFVAGAMGAVAGVALAALVILMTELAKLG